MECQYESAVAETILRFRIRGVCGGCQGVPGRCALESLPTNRFSVWGLFLPGPERGRLPVVPVPGPVPPPFSPSPHSQTGEVGWEGGWVKITMLRF